MKVVAVIAACAALLATPVYAEFNVTDISSTVNQIKKLMPAQSNSKSTATYIPPGMGLTLSDGQRAKAYGYDCQSGEKPPCGSIRITAGSHKVLIVPTTGKSFDERWTFKRLDGDNMVAVRPDGSILEAQVE